MNPHETQELLQLVTALWPRHPITQDTADAWAIALTPVNAEIAKRAVIAHSQSEAGCWPPAIADITAAMRAKQRETTPVSETLAAIHAADLAAARDRQQQKRRTAEAMARLGPLDWTRALDDDKTQLVAEFGHEHIPTPLIAKRACDLADIQAEQ